jgi:hypothetical protein
MTEYRVMIEGSLFVEAESAMDALLAADVAFGEKFPHECDITIDSAIPMDGEREAVDPEALVETANVLSDPETMAALAEARSES